MWDPQDLEDYFLNEDVSNCCFIVDNAKLYAHSNILSIRCPYFALNLKIDCPEGMNQIEWPDVPGKQFKEVLRYVYLTKIEVDDWKADELIPLLRLARRFNMARLGRLVMDEITSDRMTLDIAGNVYDVATELGMWGLSAMAVNYVSENATEAFKNESIFKRYSRKFVEALLDKNTRVEEDDHFLTALLTWQGSHGAEDVRKVFNKVRWRLMPPEKLHVFIRWLLESKDWLMDDIEPLSAATSTCSLNVVGNDVNLVRASTIDRIWSSAAGTFVENMSKFLKKNDPYRENFGRETKETVQIYFRGTLRINRIRFEVHDTILAGIRIIAEDDRSDALKPLYQNSSEVQISFPPAYVSMIEIAYYERLSVGALGCYLV